MSIFKTYDPINYSVNTTHGYYGEEIASVTLDKDDFVNAIQHMLELPSNVEKIKYILETEYSFLLPNVISATTCEIECIEIQDIKLNDEYIFRLKKNNNTAQYNKKLPAGVVMWENDRYRLIDGYHRLTSMMQDKVTSTSYVVLASN